MNEENDQDIREAFEPAPMDGGGPSAEMLRILRVMAKETPAKRPWWHSRWTSVALAGGAAAVFAAVTLMPAKASAKSFDLIEAAAQRVNAFQFSIRSDKEGKSDLFSIAGNDGKIYMRAAGEGVMEFDKGSMTIYDPTEKKAMRIKFGDFAEAEDVAKEIQSGLAEGMKDMDLKKMLQEYRQKYGERGVRISPITQENGHSVYHVVMTTPDQPERVSMTVDAASDLPEELLVESNENGQWHSSVEMEMKYGNRVDRGLLHSSIPDGTKIEELDLGAIVGDAMKGLGDTFDKMGKDLKVKIKK